MSDYYSLNSVVLVGYMGSEINHGKSKAGIAWATFLLATNEKFKTDEDPRAQYHKITAWGKRAERILEWGEKGKCMIVRGKLRHEKFPTAYGTVEIRTYVQLDEFTFLGRKTDADGDIIYEQKPEDPI